MDPGFADDDTVELENSNEPSPEQAQPPTGPYEDPELYEIAKKLKELEATDSEEENLPAEGDILECSVLCLVGGGLKVVVQKGRENARSLMLIVKYYTFVKMVTYPY